MSELQPHIIDIIRNLAPPLGSNPPDYIVWNTNSDGVFTICEACTQLAKELRDSDIRLFDFVWRWNGPQHIRDYSLEDCERNPSKEWAYRSQTHGTRHFVPTLS